MSGHVMCTSEVAKQDRRDLSVLKGFFLFFSLKFISQSIVRYSCEKSEACVSVIQYLGNRLSQKEIDP